VVDEVASVALANARTIGLNRDEVEQLQAIYVSPQKHVIIVRTGIQFGIPSTRWLGLFRELAGQL